MLGIDSDEFLAHGGAASSASQGDVSHAPRACVGGGAERHGAGAPAVRHDGGRRAARTALDATCDSTPTLRLEELVDREALDELCKSFYALFGIPVRIYSGEGVLLADAGEEQEICAYVNTLVEGREACAQRRRRGEGARPGRGRGTRSHPCFTGAALPRHRASSTTGGAIGRLIVGPFLPATVDASRRRRSSTIDPGIDAGRARNAAPARCRARRPRPSRASPRTSRPRSTSSSSAATRRSSRAQMHLASVRESYRELEEKNGEAPGGVRPAEGARSPQVELPRHGEPRASHAAHVDHRLQRDARPRGSPASCSPSRASS